MILTPSWFPWQQAFIRERQMRTNHRRSVAAYSRDTGTSSALFALQRWDVRLTNLMHDHTVEGHTKTEDEIKKAEQYEALKQVFLRLLDDPQVQQKLVTLVSRQLRQIRGG